MCKFFIIHLHDNMSLISDCNELERQKMMKKQN